MTGALSPVITDSSTVATPSITSPSPGIVSPAAQITTSPARSFDEGTWSMRLSAPTRFAIVSVLVFRSDSACALPRASAMASANVANSTVNQSHTSICSPKPMLPDPVITSRTRNTSTNAAPTSTTKMTGFFISVTGFNLSTASLEARCRISGSKSGRARTSFFGINDSSAGSGDAGCGLDAEGGGAAGTADGDDISQLQNGKDTNIVENSFPSCIRKCSTIGPSDNAGKNVKAPTTITVATSKPTNNGPWVGKVPAEVGTTFLFARLPAIASAGMMKRNRPKSMHRPPVRSYHGVLTARPPNALPLFSVWLV